MAARTQTQPFTKFIVLTNGRSGSNLLVTGLQQHPQVRAYGELLAEQEFERARDASVYGLPHYREDADVVAYLSEVVFRPSAAMQRAAGFKIFYNHARGNKAVRQAWDYLAGEKDIKIIHLIRRNLFECCVSHEVAYRSDVWARVRNDKSRMPEVSSFRIAPAKCRGFIDTMLAHRKWAFEKFRAHSHLILEYEKHLCRNYQKAINRVFRFLGVPERPIEKLLMKQAIRTPQEQVLNFVQLKRFFAGTDYGVFFE